MEIIVVAGTEYELFTGPRGRKVQVAAYPVDGTYGEDARWWLVVEGRNLGSYDGDVIRATLEKNVNENGLVLKTRVV